MQCRLPNIRQYRELPQRKPAVEISILRLVGETEWHSVRERILHTHQQLVLADRKAVSRLREAPDNVCAG